MCQMAVTKAVKLPNRGADRMWGGPGVGVECSVCGIPVNRDELEFELEFAQADTDSAIERHHVHIGCFAAWEREYLSSSAIRRSS